MWIGCLQERCFPNHWLLVTLHPEFPSVVGRQPWLAFHEYTATRLAWQGTTRRTDVPQATMGCSDALGTSIMMTLPLQSVNAESGENSSQNSP
ncbi:hypothetical protein EV363DRAFT_1218295, partial [Boletus edulis]